MKKENKFVFSKKKILNKHLALNEKTLEKLMSGERGWILITHVRFCQKIKGNLGKIVISKMFIEKISFQLNLNSINYNS